MRRSWWYRFSFLLAVVVISTMAVIPTFFGLSEQSSFPVKSKINLGLDLQGGLYIVLGINFQKVYRDEVKNYARKLTSLLEDEGIASTVGDLDIADVDDPKHSIVITNRSEVEAALAKIREFYSYPLRVTDESNSEIQFALGRDFKAEIENNSVSKSIEVIRNRIDEFGVTEPEIVSLGTDRIVVQLPGVKDVEKAKELIGKTAKLEFRMVNDDVNPADIQQWLETLKQKKIEYKRGESFSNYLAKANQELKESVPKGHSLAFEKRVNKITNEIENQIPYVLENSVTITGDDLQDATVRIDQQNNRPYVALSFKPSGARRFEELTGKNVGRRMAIVLDGNVYSAPNISQRIAGGEASITLGTGNYNDLLTEARDLALVLRAGALPVELEFQEQRIVGPSLGADSIEKAEIAGLLGAFLVFAFILWYYKISGFLATATLITNVIIVLACLVGLEATLTLPGIAGIALTVGMAVDANIIIYERIKEELALGAHPNAAMESGFSKAFWTILDANLTTAVAGFFLLNFGTGPIRGFAVTLLIGIIATVYSSYFVGNLLMEFYLNKVQGKELSI